MCVCVVSGPCVCGLCTLLGWACLWTVCVCGGDLMVTQVQEKEPHTWVWPQPVAPTGRRQSLLVTRPLGASVSPSLRWVRQQHRF